jgi:hypothetical protein
MPSLQGRRTRRYCVLKVTGAAVGHNWEIASLSAAAQTAETSALLTVLTGWPFVLLQFPSPLIEPGYAGPEIDDVVRSINQRADFPVGEAYRGDAFTLPDWTTNGWDQLRAKPWLASAALTFHEACSLADTRPSFAMVGLVASIEAVGLRLFDLSMCSCGQHRDVTARYRATVELVTEAADTEILVEAYRVRSKAVHQGILPGYETVRGGQEDIDPYTLSDLKRFEYSVLALAKVAARSLLTLALRNELPPKRSLESEC